jgi:uncharacterized membrane-anchored protein
MSQSPNNIEKIVTRGATLWLGEDGIVRIIHVPGAELTLEDARETMAAFEKLSRGKRRPLFVDISNINSLAREGRQLFAGEEAARVASVVALVVGTPVSKVFGNFFLGISTSRIPTRLFTSEDEALEWLKGHIE